MNRTITVAFYGRHFVRSDWHHDFDCAGLRHFVDALAAEFAPFGITIRQSWEEETVLEVRGYGDLLNCVRLRSLEVGVANHCLGHVIGASANCSIEEDLRRGISRLAFAPEMIEPEGENRRVCHNCGCGC